jgi:hypothetical protein
VTTPQKITRGALENYLCCKRKGSLAIAGESETKTDYETWRLIMAAQEKMDSLQTSSHIIVRQPN